MAKFLAKNNKMFKFCVESTKAVTDRFKKIQSLRHILEKLRKENVHYKESLMARFLVADLGGLKINEMEDFLFAKSKSFYSERHGFYWSTSHKGAWLAASINRGPIGVDLEINRKRCPELFDIFSKEEWLVLGHRNWKNFYKGWTAKEAALKVLSLNLENLKEIQILEKQRNRLLLRYFEKILTSQAFQRGKIIFSISRQNNDN